MSILIDKRGKGESAIHSILSVRNVPLELIKLESADYVIGNRGIERKSVNDLVNSMCRGDRHLWRQLETLKNTYERPLIMVEGKLKEKGVVHNLINSIAIGWGIPLFFTNNVHDSAYTLQGILEKYVLKEGKRSVPPAVVDKQYTPERIRWGMLQTVKGVGSVTATKILTEIPDILFSHWGIESLDEKLRRIKGLNEESRTLLLKAICYE